MTSLREGFATLVGSGDACALDRAALEIARLGHPTLDPRPSLARLDALADEIRPRLAFLSRPDDRVHVIVQSLFGDYGFTGNHDAYYDPRNSFLNDVLERRTGIPITLSVVLIEVARRLGVEIHGVGFPGHFLVHAPTPRGGIVLDPFNGGRVVTDAELLERLRALTKRDDDLPRLDRLPADVLKPVSTPAILGRMLRNLLHIYLEARTPDRALLAVDLLLVLHPDSATELRTRGMLYVELDCPAAAADDFRRYLELAPGAPDADAVRGQLGRLLDAQPTVH